MRVDWTDRALDRAEEIALYIAQDDSDSAIRWTIGLFAAVDRLAEFRESGRMVPELHTPEVRELIYGTYRVFYHVGSTVEILSVRHGSQLVRRDELGGS